MHKNISGKIAFGRSELPLHQVIVFLFTPYIFNIQNIGKIPLSDATLIEDPNEQFQFTVEDGGLNAIYV